MAAHIESLNLPVPSQIAIMSKNCAWWLMADLAIMMTGHVSVPIYPTLTAETVKYTLEHSESQLLFVGKLDTRLWNEMKNGVPGDMKCISFPLCPDGLAYDKWADLVGKSEEINEVKKRTSTELATIILIHEWEYGSAQGCHDQFENMTTTTLGLNDLMRINQKDCYLSYLPLSHSMERWVGECLPFVTGCHVYYADSLSSGSGGSGGEPGDTATARDHVIDLTGAGASSGSLSECSSDLSNGSNISNRDHVIDLTGTGASESSSSSISFISDIGFPAISNEFPDNWRMNFTQDARIKPESLLGKHVAKYFEQYKKFYHGVVDEVIADGCFPLWRIVYDDGDKEDLDMSELKKCLLFYEDLHKTSTKYGNKNKSSRRSS